MSRWWPTYSTLVRCATTSRLSHDMRMIFDKGRDRDERYRLLLRRARYNLDVCLAHWY
jgi:hypothetical protein